MSLETTYSSTVPAGGATIYKLWPVLTYSNGYWEVYRCFQEDFLVGGRGWEEEDILGELSIEEFVMGEENFHDGSAGFTSIIKKKKNNEKINMKKLILAGSKEQH